MSPMASARHKLNEFYLIGSFIIAALIGGLFGSWTVFVIVAAMLVVGSLYSGEIRPSPQRTPQRKQR
jgi:hypothetical protein